MKVKGREMTGKSRYSDFDLLFSGNTLTFLRALRRPSDLVKDTKAASSLGKPL